MSTTAGRVIGEPTNEILASAASAWEIATKRRIGKLPEAASIVEDFPQVLRESRFRELPVTVGHALAAGALSGPHRDPFDRMLIAQSRSDGIPIVTTDPVFARYGVEVIW